MNHYGNYGDLVYPLIISCRNNVSNGIKYTKYRININKLIHSHTSFYYSNLVYLNNKNGAYSNISFKLSMFGNIVFMFSVSLFANSWIISQKLINRVDCFIVILNGISMTIGV